MRKWLSGGILTVFVLALVLPAAAQDSSMAEGMITCDSTLVTLLYVAESDYGFHSMMDTSQFDKGQYGPLFEHMMAQMDSEMMEATPADDSMMEATPMDNMAMGDTMMLPSGAIDGEPQECSALRTEIETYLYDHFTMQMNSDTGM